MKIFLTFDYELFFGDQSGSVEKCMIEPTNELFGLARERKIFYTFFVDVGYLIAAEKYDELKTELDQVKDQVRLMVTRGHDVQLHIHPHWEKAKYEAGKWEMNTKGAYKLSDFQERDFTRIIKDYKTYLEELIGREIDAFRAGGWCIQPFHLFEKVFKEVGLRIDSSVISGGYMMTDDYFIDFTNAPKKSKYNFENDVCEEVENGSFTEYPISSLRYSPMFFWQLYILGRLFPKQHKMVGDGLFLSQGGRKKRVLTMYTDYHVSTDGYYAKKLNVALDKAINLKHQEMVIIGHPKGNTVYGLRKLKSFIERNHEQHEFTSFNQVL